MLFGLFLMTAFWGCQEEKPGSDSQKPPVDTTTIPKDSLDPRPVVRDTTFMRLVGKWYFANGAIGGGGETLTLNSDGTGLLTTYGSGSSATHTLTWDAEKDKLDLTYNDTTYHRAILRWRSNDWYNIKPRDSRESPYEYIRFTNMEDIPQTYWDVINDKES